MNLKNAQGLKAVIIDDDAVNIDILKELLSQKCPDILIAGQASNAADGIAVIKQVLPHIVFLDIEMPYGNGFELLKQLQPVDFEVVFTTAYDEYALEAIKFSALDYLLKPINAEELKAAVAKASQRLHQKTVDMQLNNLFNILSDTESKPVRIALPVKDGFDFVEISDIIHCFSKNGYTYIHTREGKKYISQKTLNEYEELTARFSFCRVHHASLINTSFIKKYIKEGRKGGHIELTDGTLIEISSRRKDDFLASIVKG